MFKGKVWSSMVRKENPSRYEASDRDLKRVLGVKDFLALGVGTIVSTAIFTLPGVVAAQHTGPSVVLSFIIAAIVAGFVAFAYAEMAATMPFAGSAYSWISVIFGEVYGWIAGWALLAEYFIAVAFVGSGLSANFRGELSQFGIRIPAALSGALDTHNFFGWPSVISGPKGGVVDLFTIVAILLVAYLLSKSVNNTSRVEVILVVAKVLAILTFVVVGATALHLENYVPFIPAPHTNPDGSAFGGWGGIQAGVSMIFLAYIGFDSIAANSAEAKNPAKTMPRGILGSLLIAVVLFSAVSLVLVGMFKYTNYAGNAEPVGWALRHAGFGTVALIVQAVAVVGMFTALIGMMMAGSRLLYAFGRDGMLPEWLGRLNHKGLPNHGLLVLTIGGVIIGGIFPFTFLAQLISAGTLIAFIFVSFAIYPLRKREGIDLADAGFKMPGYPFTPAIAGLLSIWVFWSLSDDAKLGALVWFIVGIIVYLLYGRKHSHLAN
ncbi:APC family permease [Weissella halotolerans]|uniref:Amino acid transporter n=1 Tax=Weissella halotolerans DSM 20190 TaxID=1123500 RepID=A0A0R2FXV0_9LACO|nr:amino acid permease [Weissella halotolerans]KRN33225.1 amino acid transporter [Weissella halotolerans DSM 20190]